MRRTQSTGPGWLQAEFEKDRSQGLFAATPPLEAKNMLMSMAMTMGIGIKRGQEQQGMVLDFIDAIRA